MSAGDDIERVKGRLHEEWEALGQMSYTGSQPDMSPVDIEDRSGSRGVSPMTPEREQEIRALVAGRVGRCCEAAAELLGERDLLLDVLEAARRYISASEADGYELTDYQRIVKAVREYDVALGARP